MRSIKESLSVGIEDRLYFATFVGIVAAVFTIILTPFSLSSPISGEPVLLAGLIVGFYYSNHQTDIRDAAIHTGLVSSIGILVLFSHKVWVLIQMTTVELNVLIILLYPLVVLLGIAITLFATIVPATMIQWTIDKFMANSKYLGA